MMNIVLFENERVEDLYPFSVLHASWEVLCGAEQTWQRLSNENDVNLNFVGRASIKASFMERNGLTDLEMNGVTLYIDGALLISSEGFRALTQTFERFCSLGLDYDNKFLAILMLNDLKVGYVSACPVDIYDQEIVKDFNALGERIDINTSHFNIVNYLFEAIRYNGMYIANDFNRIIRSKDNNWEVKEDWGKNIFAGENVSIGENVVFDDKDGPIIIDDDVKIEHGAVIYGPAYIGKKTRIKTNSVIEPECSIGPVCKVGGEIENSIIQGYSNKQHSGFLGHSYLCEWVNLGANTDNSDLKNTYGIIDISLRGVKVETGSQFMGCLIGDHTKTSIGTKLNTGTVIGIHSMIALDGFPPTDIRSYNWTGSKKKLIYKSSRALQTAKIVMNRRNKELNPHEEDLMLSEFERIKEYYYGN